MDILIISSDESQCFSEERGLNEVYTSENDQYKAICVLGEGTFGKVVQCFRKSTEEAVAIKIIKNSENYIEAGQREIHFLMNIRKADPYASSFVRTYDSFHYENRYFLVFEMMQCSLRDYLQRHQGGLQLKEIRIILTQLFNGLFKLKTLTIVHTDLKPENIMMIDPHRQPSQIKIIDFGSARYVHEAQINDCLQTIYYRSPEILLGIKFTEAIDMWSVGCIAAELLTGNVLFPGLCEFDQLYYITNMLGSIPLDMLTTAPKATKYFNFSLPDIIWRLKGIVEYKAETGTKLKIHQQYLYNNLNAACERKQDDEFFDDDLQAEIERRQLIELIGKILQLNPINRIKPQDAVYFIRRRLKMSSMQQQNPTQQSSFSEFQSSQQLSNTQYLPLNSSENTSVQHVLSDNTSLPPLLLISEINFSNFFG